MIVGRGLIEIYEVQTYMAIDTYNVRFVPGTCFITRQMPPLSGHHVSRVH